jgi:DNA invertase Pin-like site-specific DNA recombinase
MTCGKSTLATEKESEMPTPLVPVAQYLRKSTEHPQYSLAFQPSTLKSYAEKNNFTIVQTYTDSKSGLVLKHRKGLVNLLHDVVAGGAALQGHSRL